MTNYERETIINYNDEEKIAEVYTCNKALMRKLDKFCISHPDTYKLIKQDDESKTYEFPKKLVSIRTPRPPSTRIMSDEQKQAARDRLAKMRENKKNKSE